MEELKTNYKDSLHSGDLLYKITTRSDGNSTIEDVTTYTQGGDRFGAKDINETNAAVNRNAREIAVTIPANKWSANAPFTQTITVNDVLSSDNPLYMLDTSSSLYTGSDKSGRASLNAQFSYIDDLTTQDGSIVLICRDFKPASDIPIVLRGC